MPSTRNLFPCAPVLAALWLPAVLDAAEAPQPPVPLTITGDVRLRFERDKDSHTSFGALRTDRDRGRARARLNAAYKASSEWSFSARVRTGSPDSQQSPHLTFASSDNVTDDLGASFDRYFAQYKKGALTAWAGRNTTPFWQQNEMFWDEDVTPTGVALSHDTKLAQGTLTSTAGGFLLPDGNRDTNGKLFGAQLKYTRRLHDSQLTIAGGLHSLDGKRGAAHLRNRNGVRGYTLGILSAQWTKTLEHGLPLTLGIDLIENFQHYTETDAMPFAAKHATETSGWVLSATYGQLKNPRDWQLGYYYAHIEAFAVNASYAQDDWARFGSATQSDLTDIKGHEFRATVVLTKTINAQARLFLVDAITSVQDGNRLRVDLNWRF